MSINKQMMIIYLRNLKKKIYKPYFGLSAYVCMETKVHNQRRKLRTVKAICQAAFSILKKITYCKQKNLKHSDNVMVTPEEGKGSANSVSFTEWTS